MVVTQPDAILADFHVGAVIEDLLADGLEGVPFVVAPDGRVSKGRPKNLKSWLESAE
ncbi:hypothetical protein H5B81_024425 [Escherichia coli]|uniref:hypothetical protein n=1 Tax=Escherichia coli TaxID=562 RepID=UPI001D07EC45|nr:hypothetical protein [Escherichia coli]MCB6224606.1 hypothetical protein [Escherichia coli]